MDSERGDFILFGYLYVLNNWFMCYIKFFIYMYIYIGICRIFNKSLVDWC